MFLSSEKPFPIITSLTHNVGAIKYYGFCNINYEYFSRLILALR